MKTYLALGDSYTIGESVLLTESFPYQIVQLLRKKNIDINAPEIIAKTGWTTDELTAAMEQYTFAKKYDYITLLIGVNNQYRGRSVKDFKIEFDHLLQQALLLSGNMPKNVFILSIPDWSKTPFAYDKDVIQIAKEIDGYNATCKEITLMHKANFLDITTSQRADAHKSEMMASDGLHPSSAEYKKWAVLMNNFLMDKG